MHETPRSLHFLSAILAIVGVIMLASSQITGVLGAGIVALLCYVAIDFQTVLSRSPILLKVVFGVPGALGLMLIVLSEEKTFLGGAVCMLPVLASLYLIGQVSKLAPSKGLYA